MIYSPSKNEPIAIVGSSCRFSGGADTPSTLWDLLSAPTDLSRRPPQTRFNTDGFFHEDAEHHGTSNVSRSYFLEEDPRLFDAGFFNITPKEAEAIDPQQRLLLECVYEAMESAGLTIHGLLGSQTSVYVGLMIRDFMDTQVRDPDFFSQYMVTGTSSALNANRISYFFDWHGPSMTVDTACSSSLVAVHQAVQGLRSGESKVACVSGSNLLLGPELFISASNMHMLSSQSRMWDVDANGYARGDGFATVFLKTLSNALADGDHIESIIRETGVNSDGRTRGITMPSPAAQASLIRETYKRSGLDPHKSTDRCQYFEAHGTGTQAGDPQEASAIHEAFFSELSSENEPPENVSSETPKLIVGSIKTIVGHTEGAAGIAGLLKASLALQHQYIPPNLHFNTLNPSIAPFYEHLEVPIAMTPWPLVQPGFPLRASVNSFGFGGTNAHAILERYDPKIHGKGTFGNNGIAHRDDGVEQNSAFAIPLLFSANTEEALITMVRQYSEHLKIAKSLNLKDLSWTLRSRRTVMPVKAAFSGLTPLGISKEMVSRLEAVQGAAGAELGTRSKSINESKPCILGVFTGQGAQWASMGRHLLESSAVFSNTIQKLEDSLAELPDSPTWSLKAEIIAPPPKSRLAEAALSQPLCTAIQVALVDLLYSSGVSFQAVVGHSSGEIAAAYATGILTAVDAIRIAYYRGVYAKLAKGSMGAKGSMLAAGMSVDEAQTFCNNPQLRSRVVVAASNSPTSVTLSGDEIAVKEAKGMLDSNKKFARLLQVDTAYHSHHMIPCAEPYVASLQASGIKIQEQSNTCSWISSVYGSDGDPSLEELTATYWRDNMTQTVLFSQAIERAMIEVGPFDAILEIGPHPALKGPVMQTLKEFSQSTIPYSGVLDRTKNDVLAFGDALAFLWLHVGPYMVDFDGYASACEGVNYAHPSLVKDLPSYPWDHSQVHWRESRLSKDFRTRDSHPHELLGHRTPGNTEHEQRWRNILRPEEVAWLRDHRLQGSIIVPMAAYCTMALDAALTIPTANTPLLIELQDLVVHSGIIFDEGSRGIELVFSLRRLASSVKTIDSSIETEFSLFAGPPDGSKVLKLVASGRLVIFGHDVCQTNLTSSKELAVGLHPIDVDLFYSSMRSIGLEYTGDFRLLQGLKRGWRRGSADIWRPPVDYNKGSVLHPSVLECCIQTAYSAFAPPNDTSLWTTFLPQRIERISFNLAPRSTESFLKISADVTETKDTTISQPASFTTDIAVFDPSSGEVNIQIEGLTIASFVPALESDDRKLFSQKFWARDIMDGVVVPFPTSKPSDNSDILAACERIAYYYLRNTMPQILGDQISSSHLWNQDTLQDITVLIHDLQPHEDLQFMKLIGDGLSHAPLGGTTAQNHTSIHGSLLHFLANNSVFTQSNNQLGTIVKQISHRYAQLRVLEVAIPNLGPSSHILDALSDSFSSYTYASPGVILQTNQDYFPDIETISLNSFNISQDALSQALSGEVFDLVISNYALYDRDSKSLVLANLRRHIKPGGYLLLLEPTDSRLWLRFILHGYVNASSIAEKRSFSTTPFSTVELEKSLRHAGFAGIDYAFQASMDVTIYLTQAVDETTQMLRHPLQPSTVSTIPGKLLLIGGKTLATYQIIQKLTLLLQAWSGEIDVAESFEDWDSEKPGEPASFVAAIVLADLDKPVIKDLTSQRCDHIYTLLKNVRNVVWVTQGAKSGDPNYAATLGLGRFAMSVVPGTNFQFLDFDIIDGAEVSIASALVRLVLSNVSNFNSNDRLWTQETELVFEDGKALIPRVLPVPDLNDRLNSRRRVIQKKVTTSKSTIKISTSSKSTGVYYSASVDTDTPLTPSIRDLENTMTIDVSHSALFATRIFTNVHLYICLGKIHGGGTVLALSPTIASSITVPKYWQLPRMIEDIPNEKQLELVTHYLVAQEIFEGLPAGNSIIYEPDDVLVSILADMVTGTDKVVSFLTSKQRQIEPSSTIPWTFVNSNITKRKLKDSMPISTQVFVNFASTSNRIATLIQNCLPFGCSVHSIERFLRLDSQYPTELYSEKLFGTNILRLQSLISKAPKSLPLGTTVIANPSDILHVVLQNFDPFTILDWTQTEEISIIEKPIELAGLLIPEKTYLLVDLEIDFAGSLARWMVALGARHLVIANSFVPLTKWQNELRDLDVDIRFEQLKSENKVDFDRFIQTVSESMPRVAGIVYGGAGAYGIISTSLGHEKDQDSDYLKSIQLTADNLDSSFSTQELDFFIILSSVSAIMGVGKSASSATASGYLAGLASKRRARGFSASVVHLGTVMGIKNRTTIGSELSSSDNSDQNDRFAISEADMHHILGELINIGRSNSAQTTETIIALQTSTSAGLDGSDWRTKPLFSHQILRSSKSVRKEAHQSTQSVQQQISSASTLEDALKILQVHFIAKLAIMLNLTPDSTSEDTVLIDLGIDSLVATEVRAWFLKEADTDVSITTILGGSTVTELCKEAASHLNLNVGIEDPPHVAESSILEESKTYKALQQSWDASGSSSSNSLTDRGRLSGNSDAVQTDLSDTPSSPLSDVFPKLSHSTVSRTERMSFSQTRLWFPSVYLQQSTPFNCTTSYILTGHIDIKRLDHALKSVTQRHESFRTSFSNDASTGEPIQSVFDTSHFKLRTLVEYPPEHIKSEFRRIAEYVFDLATGDTFIATLISHNSTSHTIIFGYHHIIMDGVSWQIVLNDTAKFYEHSSPVLPPLAQYVDFTMKARHLVEAGVHKESLNFWKREFAVPPQPLPLFSFAKVGTRKPLTRYNTLDYVVNIESSLVAKIRKVSLATRTTSFHFYLAAFQVMLNRFLGLEDICLGIIDANRSDQSFLNTVGFMLDMLPLRFKLNKKERFENTLRNTRTKAYSALSHSGVPLETILNELQIPASSAITPLFQVLINYRMGALKAPNLGDTKMEFLDYEDAKAPFDLAISIDEKDDGTGMLTFSMQNYLYDKEGGELLLKTYIHLLEEFATEPLLRLHEVPLFEPSLIKSAIAAGTGPSVHGKWPESQTLSQRVDAWVAAQPSVTAVKDLNGISLTYLQMFKRINDVALAMQQKGVGVGSRIAVYCEPTTDTICCILAILRIGAAYVPLDVRNSVDRIGTVIAECSPQLILYHPATEDVVSRLEIGDAALINIASISASTDILVQDVSTASMLALILYTSGSTGKPKGIVLTNLNCSVHFASMAERMGFDHDVILQQSALGFDASIGQIFYALSTGGTIIMSSNRGDPLELAALIEKEKVSVTLIMISEMSALLEYGGEILSKCSSWRIAMCGGEAFTTNLLRKFRKLDLPGLKLYNAYGPTEGTIISSIGEVNYREDFDDDFKVPVGPPLPNYGVYVLDDDLHPVPIGWPGELCIAGPAIASGYLGQAELTASKFVPDVSIPRPGGSYQDWKIIYRTGDRARILNDGSFVFLGRIEGDFQVKLRGIRIELDDISNSIIQTSEGALVDAAVIVRGGANQFLVAYVVFSKSRGMQGDQTGYLRHLLRSLPLPIYMRPAVALPLDRLPFTARGKLDTKLLESLPLQQFVDSEQDSLTDMESRLKDVWLDVLSDVGTDLQITKQSDFFSVGGNSLQLMRLRTKIHTAFGIQIPLVDLFQDSSLATIASRLDKHGDTPSTTRKALLDWEAETALPPEGLSFDSLDSNFEPQTGSISIVLTGSTGFLGREILQQLVADPRIAIVHCVAMRPGRTHGTLISSGKIESYAGDLSDPQLGLTDDDAKAIFSSANAIIHNGAEVSHMKSYYSLRSPNFDSTKEILRLVLAHAINKLPAIHYVSTAGVAHLTPDPSFAEISVASYPPPMDGSDGYVAAKWANERYLERASAAVDSLSVTIHRPSNITGEGVDDRDIVHSMLKYSATLGAVPDMSNAIGSFDFVALDTCAAGIVGELIRDCNSPRLMGSIKFLHQSGDTVIPVDELRQYLEHDIGHACRVLRWDEWVDAAIEKGMDELVGAFLRNTGGQIRMPLLVKGT